MTIIPARAYALPGGRRPLALPYLSDRVMHYIADFIMSETQENITGGADMDSPVHIAPAVFDEFTGIPKIFLKGVKLVVRVLNLPSPPF